MLDFYNDIDDVANAMDVYSLADTCEAQVPYSYDVSKR